MSRIHDSAHAWSSRVSLDYSSGVQALATRLAKLAATTNGLTPVDAVKSINAELGAIRQDAHRRQKCGREEVAADKAARIAVSRAAAKYAQAERRAASERNQAVADAMAGARKPVAETVEAVAA